jgi:serine/threonine protein phosphatase PrpC
MYSYAYVYCIISDKKRPDFNGGTTATVCLLKDSVDMAVCHVGDSRAILCRGGKAQRLTIDHEPELPGEKDRIVQAGGHITFNSLGSPSVNGRLAMTRSIGDVELKRYGVTAEPHLKGIQVKCMIIIAKYAKARVMAYIANTVTLSSTVRTGGFEIASSALTSSTLNPSESSPNSWAKLECH